MRRRTTGRRRPRSIGVERYGLADDQAELGRAGQDLNLGVRIELAAQVAKVTAHGHVADPHPGRDVPIVESSHQLPEDLALALGEQGDGVKPVDLPIGAGVPVRYREGRDG